MLKLPALDPRSLDARTGSAYPEPFRAAAKDRKKWALGDAVGLKNFGVNLVELPPGALSSQRHWHTRQDELVYVLEGEVTLMTDGGEQRLTPGMVAGFPAGVADGHHLVNRSSAPARYLEVGDRLPGDEARYSDIDMAAKPVTTVRFVHKNGDPY